MVLRLCGLALACASAACYGLAVVIQAAEARAVPREARASARLLARLARRRRWWLGTAIGLAGWPLQTMALTLAPLEVVQPALAAAPVVVVILAVSTLGERAGRREVFSVAAIGAGVAIATLIGPNGHPSLLLRDTAAVVAVLCAVGLLPGFARIGERSGGLWLVAGAGLAFAAAGLASKITADGLSSHAIGRICAGASLAAAASLIGVAAEMASYQRLAASVVAPITFGIEIALPVALAPWLTRGTGHGASFAGTAAGLALVVAGVAVLASGTAVSRTVAAAGGRGA